MGEFALERSGKSHYLAAMDRTRSAKFKIGQVVKHGLYPFRGVIFDVDPTFSNTEEWWQSIPAEVRPHKDQPFYHLFAENAETEYVAYVSEQNLLPDNSSEPIRHPQVAEVFVQDDSRQHNRDYRIQRAQHDCRVQAAGLFGADEERGAADIETTGEEGEGGAGRLQFSATAAKQNDERHNHQRRYP